MDSLQTKRLILSPVVPGDLEKIHDLHLLPETDQYNTQGIPETLDQTKAILDAWLERSKAEPLPAFILKIESLEDQKFVGLIGLNPGKPKYQMAEIWYKIHPRFWNRGFATEVVNRILEFGFDELKLHRIEAGCAIENSASMRVLEKCGMVREGQKRKALPLKTGWSDNYEYAILAEEYGKLNHTI